MSFFLATPELYSRVYRGDRVKVTVPDTVTVGGSDSTVLSMKLTFDTGWHINTNNPIQDYLIPTRITAEPSIINSVMFPPGKKYEFSFSDSVLRVYSDSQIIPFTLNTEKLLTSDQKKGQINLRYQPCSNSVCLRPTSIGIPFDVKQKNTEDRTLLLLSADKARGNTREKNYSPSQ